MPVPAFVTVNVWTSRVKLAVQARSAVIVTDPAASQSPLQPANVEPTSAVAVSVTTVPKSYTSVQSMPQSMPRGELVTPPFPVPAFVTVSVWTSRVKLAVQAPSAVIVTDPAASQSPLQPANVEPTSAVAVSVTTVPKS